MSAQWWIYSRAAPWLVAAAVITVAAIDGRHVAWPLLASMTAFFVIRSSVRWLGEND